MLIIKISCREQCFAIPFVHTRICAHTYLCTLVFVFEDAQANWGEQNLYHTVKVSAAFMGKIRIFIPNS